ncbi:Apolipophorin [Chionoecetes opilio]|uniref:Apolipophorin n=1 Tax=Chionoecetes opilio TaxID=41210 RepID=A0A8J8WG15_CHIOP|nr:Apolipophorin [Chionoecetes opilio]
MHYDFSYKNAHHLSYRNESAEFVLDMWQLYNSINSTAMELRARESVQFVFHTILRSLQEIPLFQTLKAKMARGELKGQLAEYVKKLHNFIQDYLSDMKGHGLKDRLKIVFIMITEKYDQYAKRIYLKARESIEAFTYRLGEWFYTKWRAVYNNYKPHILRTFDDVETNAWNFAENLIGWMKQLGLEVKSSAYYQRIQELVTYLENIYKDFSEKSKRENLEEYYTMLLGKIKNGAKTFLDFVAPFMEDWGGELSKAWKTLMQFRAARRVKEVVIIAINKHGASASVGGPKPKKARKAITLETKIAILKKFDEGVRVKDIANWFSLSPSTVEAKDVDELLESHSEELSVEDLREIEQQQAVEGDASEEDLETEQQLHLTRKIMSDVFSKIDSGVQEMVIWTVQYVNISGQLMDAIAFLLEHGWTIFTQTGVDASQRYIRAKTMFRCTPEKGELELVQKLPLDWHAFDHRPSWQDLPEYTRITKAFNFFSTSSNTTMFKLWHKMVKLRFSPSSLFPPFAATGYMIGEQHFITFDQRHLEYKGRCQHLLVADMVGGKWAVSVNYHQHSSRTIIIYTHDAYIEIAKDFRVSVNGVATELPVSVASVYVHRSLHALHLDSQLYGFRVNWNLAQDVTSITINGLYFGKTGGLLGLYNYEPYDDFMSPSGELQNDGTVMAESWDVSPVHCVSTGNIGRLPSKVPIEACTHLFQSKGSPLKGCFYEVDSNPYMDICLVDHRTHTPTELNTCTAAAAYMEACAVNSIPIKIPSYCVQCEYMNNDMQTMTLEEGVPVVLEQHDILKSTDVVIIIEAQHCNAILSEKKPVNRFGTFIKEINEELQTKAFTMYAIVVYGGEPPFSMPVVATVNNQIFTDASNIDQALDHISFMTADYSEDGAYSYDAFSAYQYAASLDFRAGVTISFIHFPCQSCKPFFSSMDYSTMYHILLEYSVTLHVFNQALFDIPKATARKKLLGIDRELAYTMKDAKRSDIRGDRALKSQVSVPKDKLGYCAPLAHQTNGTIFTSAALFIPRKQASRANRIKKKIQKLAIVFGRRLAKTAYPREKKRCVCIPRGPDGGGIIECDNWGSEQLSFLRDYGYNMDISYTPENNSREVGSCVERGADGECLRSIEN